MKVGDLVSCTWRDYGGPGLVFKIEIVNGCNKWAFVQWPEHGISFEKVRDLYVIDCL